MRNEIQGRFDLQAEQLQKRLSEAEMMIADSRRGLSLLLEHLVARLGNLKVKMYREPGKKTPHLHVDYGREHHNAAYSLDPPVLIEGSLARQYDRVVIEWITDNKDALREIWHAFQQERDPTELIAILDGEN